MAPLGFDYSVAGPVVRPPVPDFPYGIDDVRWAEQHGYGLADQATLATGQRDNANIRYVASLSPARQGAYDAAIFGTPGQRAFVTVPAGQTVAQSRDGCLALAEGQLYGDFDLWFRASTITTNLLPAIQPRVLADARYRQAVAAWASCVARAGHPAASPDDLRALAIAGGDDTEVALAVTDATCKRQTQLASVGHILDQELGGPIRARFGAEIHLYAQLRLAALQRAIPVIESTS